MLSGYHVWTLKQTKVQIPGGTFDWILAVNRPHSAQLSNEGKKIWKSFGFCLSAWKKNIKKFKIISKGSGAVYLANVICSLPVLALIDIIMDMSIHWLMVSVDGA